MRKVLTIIFTMLLCIAANTQDKTAFIKAVQAYTDNDLEKAKASFELLHAKDSTDDASLYYLGLCEFHTGDFDNAEKHLGKAVSIDSTNIWYINSLATLYNAAGKRRQAAIYCEKLIKLAPQQYRNSYTLCLVADEKLSSRQDSLARKYYEMALEIDPDYAPAQIGLSELMRLSGNMPGYFKILREFIDNKDVKPEIKSDYMNTLMQNIDAKFYWVWGEQISILMDRCVELYPKDIQARINKAQICMIKEDTDGMAEQFRAIIPVAREKKDTTNLLMALSTVGDYHYQKGEKKKAYAIYEEALVIKPDYAPVLNNYAYFLSEDGKKLKKALEMSRIAIENEPDNATYLDTYAWILHLLKRDKEAKPHFKHAMIYGGKESAVILEHYSIVLKALGETSLADYYHSLAEQKK